MSSEPDRPALDLHPATIALVLRRCLGLPDAPPEDVVEHMDRTLPLLVREVDVDALMIWAAAGAVLFSEKMPSLRNAGVMAKRTVALLALHRTGGNITKAAALVGTSRRSLRIAARCGPSDIDVPYQPVPAPGTAPPVVEDGTRGTVYFKYETEEAGPAVLVRGAREEHLFLGRWVEGEQARDYARTHGHAFEDQ